MNSRKQKKRIASRRRILGLEQLERREVLAGNVAASVRGGNLLVTGDNLGNDITITCDGGNGITIVGNGTTVNGQAAVTLSNFRKHVTVDLNGGNDTVTFRSTFDDLFTILGNLTVTTGGGNDEVNFADAHVKGVLFVDTGSGNDEVNGIEGFTGWSLRADRVATILTGTGNDVVSLNRARFAKTTSILLEKDHDKLFLSNSFFLKTTVLNGGLGYDRLNTVNTSFSRKPIIVLFEVRGSNPPPSTNHPPVAVNDSATVAEGATVSIDVADNDTDADGSLNLDSIDITQDPLNGSVTVNGDGTVSYTHNGSNTTSDSFRYIIEDDDGAVSGTATVNITVTPVNDAPVAVNDTATVAEGGTVSIPVSSNDTDSDGTIDPTSIVVTQSPANGTFVVNANGSVSYTHNGSDTTSDSFRYTIKDNNGATSGTATVNITVTPVNDAPVAVNDTATLAEGATLAIPVSTNDTDSDGTIDPTTIVITQSPVNGTAAANANGTVTYTHNGSETTSDTFRYTIKDNSGAVSGTATVNITITPANDAPVAANDTATVAEGAPIAVPVAANDTDADGTIDPTTVVITQAPANGTAVANVTGTVTYTHNGSETTSDTFRYTIKDNNGLVSNTATVTITVTPVNDAPVAVNDTATVAEGATASIPVSTNDTDADGTIDPNSIVIIQAPTNGTAVANANGTVTYTHNGSETTSDSLTYTIKDNSGAVSGTATVAITVTPVNDAPVAQAGTLTTNEDTLATGTLVATDVDSAALVYSLVDTSTAHGTVTITNPATGAYSYSPDLDYNGPASFTFKANDGTLDSNTATISITVTPVNDAPVAQAGTLTTNEDTLATGTLVATDVDSPALTYSLVDTSNAHGTVTITNAATGAYSYSPDLDYNGPASFTFKASDGTLDSNVATISITVAPVNDAPVAADGTLITAEDTPATGTLVATDGDSATLTYSVVDQSNAHGTVTITNPATGAYSYSPDLDYNGPASFTFKVSDGTLDSNTATISITVTPVNDAPVAQAGTLTTSVDTLVTGTLVATDVDSAALVYSVVDASTAHGTVTITNPVTGAYSYNPDLGYIGPASFTFKANDGTLDSNVAAITITVTS